MAGPRPDTVSPVVVSFPDNDGKTILIRVFFDLTSRAITRIETFRDPACRWTRILVGVGATGPDSTDKAITIPAGEDVATSQELRRLKNAGMGTIEEFRALQITAA